MSEDHAAMLSKAIAEIRQIWETNRHLNPEAFDQALDPLPEEKAVNEAFGKPEFREVLVKWYRRQVLELRKAAKEAA